MPMKLLKLENKYASNLYEFNYVIIRPDLMIAWRSNSLPLNPFEVLDVIRGEK